MRALAAAVALVYAGVASAAEPVLVVEGAGVAPRSFGVAELARMPRRTAAREDHGKRIACEGVALADLLQRAGAPSGEGVRGAALATAVLVTARDGYRVGFTLGELDPLLGNAAVVVADRCDGRALGDEAGPFRLVAPGDRRGARSVRQVVRVSVVPVGR